MVVFGGGGGCGSGGGGVVGVVLFVVVVAVWLLSYGLARVRALCVRCIARSKSGATL